MKSKWNTFIIYIANFIIRHLTFGNYAEKLDLTIKQGLYHADNLNGPFILNKQK